MANIYTSWHFCITLKNILNSLSLVDRSIQSENCLWMIRSLRTVCKWNLQQTFSYRQNKHFDLTMESANRSISILTNKRLSYRSVEPCPIPETITYRNIKLIKYQQQPMGVVYLRTWFEYSNTAKNTGNFSIRPNFRWQAKTGSELEVNRKWTGSHLTIKSHYLWFGSIISLHYSK